MSPLSIVDEPAPYAAPSTMSNRVAPLAFRRSGSCERVASSAKKAAVGSAALVAMAAPYSGLGVRGEPCRDERVDEDGDHPGADERRRRPPSRCRRAPADPDDRDDQRQPRRAEEREARRLAPPELSQPEERRRSAGEEEDAEEQRRRAPGPRRSAGCRCRSSSRSRRSRRGSRKPKPIPSSRMRTTFPSGESSTSPTTRPAANAPRTNSKPASAARNTSSTRSEDRRAHTDLPGGVQRVLQDPQEPRWTCLQRDPRRAGNDHAEADERSNSVAAP